MSSQGNNNNGAESFLRNHVNHVGIQIPFEVYPTELSELRVVSPGGTGMREGKISLYYFSFGSGQYHNILQHSKHCLPLKRPITLRISSVTKPCPYK